ncbi:hypothetical protein LV779_36860 [Streptomyces thinghirensis]|nr:hypothetical protein [Streptomyces thinghirensis]
MRWRGDHRHQWARFAAGEVDFVTQRPRPHPGLPGPTGADGHRVADDWFQRYASPTTGRPGRSSRRAARPRRPRRPQPPARRALQLQPDRPGPQLRVLGVHDRFEAILCAADRPWVSAKPSGAFLAACTTP